MNKLFSVRVNNYITFQNFFNLLFLLIAAFFVLSTCYATYSQFTSIPFWDSWDGYFNFILTENKSFFDFFSQHNEHRIFFTRLLFYIDYYLFGADLYFLIIMNLFFQTSLAIIFYYIITKALDNNQYKSLVVCISCILAFSFIQHENTTWEFQSQFYLASLFPLLSILALYKFSEFRMQNTSKAKKYFFVSLCLALFSCYTMANGIFVFIVYFIGLLYLKMSKKNILYISAILIIYAIIYFIDYSMVQGHFTIFSTLFNNPANFFTYLYLFIASPIQYALNNTTITLLFGLSLIIFCSVQIISICNKPEKFKPFSVFLMLFAVFVLIYAFVVATGRAGFGVTQAYGSRYTTPVLILFAVLFAYILSLLSKNYEKVLLATAIALCFLFFPYQLNSVLHSKSNHLKQVAALATTFDIDDPSSNILHPATLTSYGITKKLVEQKKGFVTQFPYSYIYKEQNKWQLPENANPLVGQIDHANFLESENEFVKVVGWAYDAGNTKTPKLVLIAFQGKVIGFGFTGEQRLDVAESLKISADHTGFIGYMLNLEQEQIEYSLYTVY